ncbi:unnamed protein product [Gemmata massiliana]|uniref:Uncharacterized protein n=1 Tax=Gemmata massiliana TaxID=1210884 RepID=A0A6P2D5I9_9BACT|nr:unnamed protein product [Gemmata massiliana]
MYACTDGGKASKTSGGSEEVVMPPKWIGSQQRSSYPSERLPGAVDSALKLVIPSEVEESKL